MGFQTGDRVVLLDDLDHDVPRGTKGTVTQPVATNSYWVRFDGENGDRLVPGTRLEKVVSEAIPGARGIGARGRGTKGKGTKTKGTKGKGTKGKGTKRERSKKRRP